MSDHRESGSDGRMEPKQSVEDLLRLALLRERSLLSSADREGVVDQNGPAEDPFADESVLSSEELLAAEFGSATYAEKGRVGWKNIDASTETVSSDSADAVSVAEGPRAFEEEPARRLSIVSIAAAAVLMISAAILGIAADPEGPTEESAVASLRRGALVDAEAWLLSRSGFEGGVSETSSIVESTDGQQYLDQQYLDQQYSDQQNLGLWTTGESANRSASETLSPIRILTPRVRSLARKPAIRVATRGLADGIALSAVIEDLDGRVWLDADLTQGFATWPASAEALEPGRPYRLTVSGPTPHSPRSRTAFTVAAPRVSRMMDATQRKLEREIKHPTLRVLAWSRFLARSGFQGEALASLASVASFSALADEPGVLDADELIAFLRLRAATDLAHDLSVWVRRNGPR